VISRSPPLLRRRFPVIRRLQLKELQMLYSALVFLLVGLIAVALGLAGVAVIPTQVSWTVFLIGVALLVTQLVTGRTTRVAYIL